MIETRDQMIYMVLQKQEQQRDGASSRPNGRRKSACNNPRN